MIPARPNLLMSLSHLPELCDKNYNDFVLSCAQPYLQLVSQYVLYL